MKTYLNVLIVAFTLVVVACIASYVYSQKITNKEIIVVTGLGEKDFTSDLIVWSGYYTRTNSNLKQAYELLGADTKEIKVYLSKKGVEEDEIVFASVNISQNYDYIYDKLGNSSRIFTGYSLSQQVEIKSKDINLIEKVSREITELINAGVELNSYAPQYYYTQLAELKKEMIATATKDAHTRAEIIATNSAATLGKLKLARMGVFQIIAQNSTEDYSWGGSYNTSSKEKTATITMKLEFGIK